MTSCADFLWMIADDKDVYIFAWTDYSRYGRDSTVHVAMLVFLREIMGYGNICSHMTLRAHVSIL